MAEILRSEFPRPDFERENWMTLNGKWDFSFDEPVFDKKIIVPFCYEAPLSGIGVSDFHNTVWYRKKIELPESMEGKRIFLHFGAVDYEAAVYVNDRLAVRHTGGQVGFSADITEAVKFGKKNTVVVKAFDDPADREMPRGKQYWEEKSYGIFYTRTTGIWQSVWIEAVEETHVKNVLVTPLYDEKSVLFEYELTCPYVPYPHQKSGCSFGVDVLLNGKKIASGKDTPEACNRGTLTVSLSEALEGLSEEEYSWLPEHPVLFTLEYKAYEGRRITDRVHSYFGMRKVSIEDGRFCLNNKPYFQKLVLDQGYWPESILSGPSDEAYVFDIQAMKDMGFNGVRKHQKVEDPRYLYHADRMGFLVWGEIGNSYVYTKLSAARLYTEWMENIFQNYNHPSIVAWTPLNESWGVGGCRDHEIIRHKIKAAYELTKSLEPMRPVIDNDGWEHVTGDLFTIHDYEKDGEKIEKMYMDVDNIPTCDPQGPKHVLAVGDFEYKGQPVLITEYGGMHMMLPEEKGDASDRVGNWGYSKDDSPEAFLAHYDEITSAFCKSPAVQGFCYTQVTDVEQEQNGLLFYDRSYKFDPAEMKKINDKFGY